MVNYRPLINMCKIISITLKDLPKINNLEKQLNLNETKLNFLNQTLLNENFKFVKLIYGRQIVGFLQFSWNKSDCDIISIGIIKNLQKMGYGKKLIEYLISLNFKNIFAEVSEKNKDAIIFYKKLNFLKVSLRKNYYTKLKSDAILLKLIT